MTIYEMKSILVRNYGDFWVNQQEVETQTAQLGLEQSVLFEIQEGISLRTSGVAEFIEHWQYSTGRTTEQIQISCVNHQDAVPWVNVHNDVSACWALSRRYWADTYEFVTQPAKFGLFVSRRSIARNYIMYDCATTWPDQFVLSRTKHSIPEPWHDARENFNSWCDYDTQNKIIQWYQDCPVTSIDQIWHKDQFDANKNTNASLLEHYNKFAVELCLETMTVGGSFFPTEKIARPIVGVKPFVVYAARNYLVNLRRLGFETFGDIWDESYDQYEGPERWHRMRGTIEQILSNPELVSRCADVATHNKEVLRKRLYSNDLVL